MKSATWIDLSEIPAWEALPALKEAMTSDGEIRINFANMDFRQMMKSHGELINFLAGVPDEDAKRIFVNFLGEDDYAMLRRVVRIIRSKK